MKSVYKVVVLGAPRVGKTTILEEAIYGNHYRLNTPYEPTIEDIYCGVVDTEKNTREKIYFYDYAGTTPPLNLDTIKMYLSFCDAFILVFAINDKDSFFMMNQIKKNIDKFKEKKDIPIVVVANKTDKGKELAIEYEEIHNWSVQEKVKLFEVTSSDRKSLTDIFVHIATKLCFVPYKSSFSQLRKSKTSSLQLEL